MGLGQTPPPPFGFFPTQSRFFLTTFLSPYCFSNLTLRCASLTVWSTKTSWLRSSALTSVLLPLWRPSQGIKTNNLLILTFFFLITFQFSGVTIISASPSLILAGWNSKRIIRIITRCSAWMILYLSPYSWYCLSRKSSHQQYYGTSSCFTALSQQHTELIKAWSMRKCDEILNCVVCDV